MTVEIPRDENAEASVLGACLISRRAVDEAVEMLMPEDFYLPKFQTVFETIRELASRREPVDVITVTDGLRARGLLRQIDGGALLAELSSFVPTAANSRFYIDIVREQAVLRRLMEAGECIVSAATSEETNPDAAVERARRLVDEVSRAVVTDIEWVGDGLNATFEQLRGDEEPAIPTPWSALNNRIGGLRPGALYVVGARPGVGKTVVGLNLAAHVARTHTVGFVSLEMTSEELRRRLLSAVGSVHLSSLLNRRIGDLAWQQLTEAEKTIRSMRLSIADQLSTLGQVLSYARTLHRRGNLGLLVVDYLQLMRGDRRAESRQIEVAEFSRALKLLAKELNIPVVALSQLNRESAGRKGGEPLISDLRESGALEQDADVVLLLHRNSDGREHRNQAGGVSLAPGLLKIIVAKNRHGRTGDVKLTWEGTYARAIEKWSPTQLLEEKH